MDIKLVLIRVKKLRFKLIIMFLISFIVSIFSGFLMDELFKKDDNNYYVQTMHFVKQCKTIEKKIANAKDDKEVCYIINENVRYADIFILNRNGEVLIKSKNCKEISFDIDALGNNNNDIDTKEYAIKYNLIDKLDSNRYILFSGTLFRTEHSILILIVPIIIFIVLFFILTNKEIVYIKELCLGLKEIAKGDLKYRVRIMGKDEISEIGSSINDMTNKLYEYKQKEKKIERDKESFIMNISHDLRTPLTSIIGYVNLLKSKYNCNDDIKKYIDIIDLKATRLNKLINDFFEYNKLNNYEIKLNKINISLNEFMRQVVTSIIPLCSEKNLKIKLLLPEYDDININIDPDKMFRVMENLLINAIRYCNIDSEIQLSISREKNIIICITNECDDFNKDEINNIFDKFYRGDKARLSTKGGAGLGLSIAKSIVELHNGEIFAEYNEKKICLKLVLSDK